MVAATSSSAPHLWLSLMLFSTANAFATLTVFANVATVFSYHLHGMLASGEAQFVTYPDQWVLDTKTTSSPSAPHFVIYSDQWVSGEIGPPAPSVINVRPHVYANFIRQFIRYA
jgi:hypothetical protein